MSSRTLASLFILSLLTATACNKPAPSAGKGGAHSAAPVAVPVSVTTVERQDVPVILSGLGTVQAYNTVTLRSRVDGEIMKVYFREGQEVSKGQLLAEIDPRPYQVALETAKANLARDEAQLNTAKANLARSKALLEAGVIAQQDYDTQEASAGQFTGTVQADQAAIDNARLNLAYTRITSPMDARVGLRLIDPGNIVHANDTNGMLVLTQMHPIAVLFTLPQEQLPEVLKHSRKGPLVVQAFASDDRTLLATGRLETVDNQIDTSTGTAKLKAVFDNHERTLWPNQFVNVHMVLSIVRGAVVVPSAAVQRGPDGELAYVMGADHKIAVRRVTVSLSQNNQAVIAQGLEPGEQVVVEGQDKLENGSLVVPRSSHGGTAGAKAADRAAPQPAAQQSAQASAASRSGEADSGGEERGGGR
jgi:multidrug efflux system membrane fusion protein